MSVPTKGSWLLQLELEGTRLDPTAPDLSSSPTQKDPGWGHQGQLPLGLHHSWAPGGPWAMSVFLGATRGQSRQALQC